MRKWSKRKVMVVASMVLVAMFTIVGWQAYWHFITFAYMPTPSTKAEDFTLSELGKVTGKLPPRSSNVTLYVWTNELPARFDIEQSNLTVNSVYISKAAETFAKAEHKWLIQIGAFSEDEISELSIDLGKGKAFTLTACPAVPIFGQWGLDGVESDFSTHWWKMRVVDILDTRKTVVSRHKVTVHRREFDRLPINLPPGMLAYFIRPPKGAESGVLLIVSTGGLNPGGADVRAK